MKASNKCPACHATNKRGAELCRVCGERLSPPHRTSAQSERPAPDTEKHGPRLDERGETTPARSRGSRLTDRQVVSLLGEVHAFSERGDFEHAVATAERILEDRVNDPKALRLKADAMFRAGRQKEAAEIVDILVRVDAENAWAWLDHARIHAAMQDYVEAIESYDTALALDKDLVVGWHERAALLDALPDPTQALASVNRALALRPDDLAAQSLRAELEERRSKQTVRAIRYAVDREFKEIDQRAIVRAATGNDRGPSPAESSGSPHGVSQVLPPPTHTADATSTAANRLHTYVDGLDDAMKGGIPDGHVVIVAGPPGTLKSSLCLTIAAWQAAKERRPTLYVTLEESRASFRVQAHSLGLPLEDVGDLVRVLDARDLRARVPRIGEDWVDAFVAILAAVKSETPFDLLVIDSLEALEAIAQFPDRRRAIFRLFANLRSLSVTTLVVAERPDIVVQGNVVYGRWSEDFLADGILHLRQHLVSDLDVQRRIRIVKMRGTVHETGYMALLVDDGRLRATRAIAS